jgi:hypothetical protein
VPDPSLTAARVLRVLLSLGVLLLVPAVLYDGSEVLRRLQTAGLWTLSVGPFLVLAVVSAGERQTRWYAVATIALALIGYFAAR